MKQDLRRVAILLFCLAWLSGGAGLAETEEEGYLWLNDVVAAREEILSIEAPSGLAVYRAHTVQSDVEEIARFFGISEREDVVFQENSDFQSYFKGNEILLSVGGMSVGGGQIYFYRDGESSNDALEDYYLGGSHEPLIRTEEMPNWQGELDIMPREEAAQMVGDAINQLYPLEDFEQRTTVYAVWGNEDEEDCYLVEIEFQLGGVPVTHKSYQLYSGRETQGTGVLAVADAAGIRHLRATNVLYTIEEKSQPDGQMLDAQGALEAFAQSYAGLLLSEPIRIERALLLYLPLPVPGNADPSVVEMRPVWCYEYTFTEDRDFIRWGYLDAYTGEEYDMQ